MSDPGVYITLAISFFTGLAGVIMAIITGLRSASREELKAVVEENKRLREIIKGLEDKMSAKDRRIDELEAEIGQLREEVERYRNNRHGK